MYAIIKTGGKQYRVAKNQIIDVELLDAEAGSEVTFEDVFFLANGEDKQIGEPRVAKAVVKGKIIGLAKGPKIDSVKYKRRKRQRTHWGHRQKYTRVEITEIAS
jgi:large subunit ribosomal protein L21